MGKKPDDFALYNAGTTGDEELDELMKMEAESAETGNAGGTASHVVTGVAGWITLIFVLGGLGLALLSGMVMRDWFGERGLAWLTLAGMGMTFFGAGFGALCARQWIGIIFMLVGTAVGGGAAFYTYAPADMAGMFLERIVPLLLLFVFFLTGICLLVIPPWIYKKKCMKYTQEVDAEVTGKEMRYSRDSDGHTHRLYYLTWRYYAGGNWHYYKSNTGRRPERRDVGDHGPLYVNPEKPSDCWEKPGLFLKLMFVMMGISCAAASGMGILVMLAGLGG